MNRNPNWQENFTRKVRVKCRNEFCENIVEALVNSVNRNGGVYCDPCRAEARVLHHRLETERRTQSKARRIKKAVCALPGCEVVIWYPGARKYCSPSHKKKASRLRGAK